MAQFGFNKNGELEFYSEYTIKGVSTLRDIFPKIKKTSDILKFKNNQRLRDLYMLEDKTAVIRRVFYDFLILLFNDLSNGGMLVLPGKTNANIALKTMDDDTVKRLSKEDKLKYIDIVKAKYKVPCLKFDFGPHSARKDRFIKIPMRIWSKSFRNAENGTIKYTYYRKILK